MNSVFKSNGYQLLSKLIFLAEPQNQNRLFQENAWSEKLAWWWWSFNFRFRISALRISSATMIVNLNAVVPNLHELLMH